MAVKKTDHRPEQQPTRLRLLSHRPLTRLRLLSHQPPTTLKLCFIYCAIFLPFRFYGTECPHMNGAGLNLPGKTQVIKIFLPLRFYGTECPHMNDTECPHMNDTGLNLPGKTQVIKIDRTSILNNDSIVACGFLG